MQSQTSHTFHIPVLGLCFSIDTPVKVARFGISSVVSIIEDELIEHMRAYHCLQNSIPYLPVSETEEDYRAKRITKYLDLLEIIVNSQVKKLNEQPFTAGSEVAKYFEMLPEAAIPKQRYREALTVQDPLLKTEMLEALRPYIKAGAIDVNIMSKVDNPRYSASGEKLPDEYSDALSALRGFANSSLTSSVVFSAGYNPRLFSYAEQFKDFFPDTEGKLRKKIILKVSDYRSALVQGKILAKKGLWISEFRIESGLNCGGHAFATDGLLMGPILEEFKQNREVLYQELFAICHEALLVKEKGLFHAQPLQKITAQGGIGTADEQEFLLSYYKLDGTGWGSPFLLVPEATNVDDATLAQLAAAKQEDYYLSNASPLGVPFNNFRRSSSEEQRKQRIEKNRPGSPCYKKYLSSNTEFTELPICTASRKYQHLKIKAVSGTIPSQESLNSVVKEIEEKDCLCEGLTASVRIKNDMYLPHNLSAVAICPGPNLAYFSGIFSLKQMVDHIYKREVVTNAVDRPHMLINELKLYIDYFENLSLESSLVSGEKQLKYLAKFKANLLSGIAYYRSIVSVVPDNKTMRLDLDRLEQRLLAI